MTDLHEPLDSYPDELPPPRQHGDVNLVGLLSVADDLLALTIAVDHATVGLSGRGETSVEAVDRVG
ncbi:hypothetical protein ABT255_34125 [Streptomyces mirabilis]|uniref:hypothetical protein n=1 Tax=Streptomyces mirabilis TaxID=68239 RepID=UPI003320E96C